MRPFVPETFSSETVAGFLFFVQSSAMTVIMQSNESRMKL